MIKITYYEEVIDNWGRTESSIKPEIIKSVLTNQKDWNDDMTFEDEGGKKYFIDDLIGKEVEVGGVTFTIEEE